MGKILLLAIAVWLLITVLKRYSRNIDPPERPQADIESMVQCAHCGVHLPRSDSFLINSRYYCCEAHSKQDHEHSS